MNDSLERLVEERSLDNGFDSYADALYEAIVSYAKLDAVQELLEPFKGLDGVELGDTESSIVMFLGTGCGIVLMGGVQFHKYDDRTDLNAIAANLFRSVTLNLSELQDDDNFEEFFESYTGEQYEW